MFLSDPAQYIPSSHDRVLDPVKYIEHDVAIGQTAGSDRNMTSFPLPFPQTVHLPPPPGRCSGRAKANSSADEQTSEVLKVTQHDDQSVSLRQAVTAMIFCSGETMGNPVPPKNIQDGCSWEMFFMQKVANTLCFTVMFLLKRHQNLGVQLFLDQFCEDQAYNSLEGIHCVLQ